jgi:hypothetical protein
MDQYSLAELTELYFLRESDLEIQFQFWLYVTFAAVVASFAAGRHLNKKLRYVTALLYALAVAVIATRWYYYSLDVLMFRTELEESGVELAVAEPTYILRILLVALGTSAALMFMLSNKFLRESDE